VQRQARAVEVVRPLRQAVEVLGRDGLKEEDRIKGHVDLQCVGCGHGGCGCVHMSDSQCSHSIIP
jgi:hypothetical protein